MGRFIEHLKLQATKLKIETYALYLAIRDPRTPLFARIFAGFVVGYAFSPIDLIPDFIPVIGYIDDLILVPLGVRIAISMIPENVMIESRQKAQKIMDQGKPVSQAAAVIIILIWIILALLCISFVINIFKR